MRIDNPTAEEKQKTVVKADAYYGLFTGAVLIRKILIIKN